MKFINRSRCSGKTTMLINTAHITGYPIIVWDQVRAKFVYDEQARKMGINDIEVITLREYTEHKNIGMNNPDKNVLIDEADRIIENALNYYLQSNVVACTFSIPYEDIKKKEEDNGGQ